MRSKSMLAMCLLLLFLTACQKQTSDDPVVATYKDTQILQSEVAYEKENQINVTGDKTVSDADALDQILLNLIMLDEAEQRGLSVTQEEVDAELAGQRKLRRIRGSAKLYRGVVHENGDHHRAVF